jgi:hypothetical protein
MFIYQTSCVVVLSDTSRLFLRVVSGKARTIYLIVDKNKFQQTSRRNKWKRKWMRVAVSAVRSGLSIEESSSAPRACAVSPLLCATLVASRPRRYLKH